MFHIFISYLPCEHPVWKSITARIASGLYPRQCLSLYSVCTKPKSPKVDGLRGSPRRQERGRDSAPESAGSKTDSLNPSGKRGGDRNFSFKRGHLIGIQRAEEILRPRRELLPMRDRIWNFRIRIRIRLRICWLFPPNQKPPVAVSVERLVHQPFAVKFSLNDLRQQDHCSVSMRNYR